MSTITKPMALDESFNTTESTPRNQADVLAGIESAIRQGFGQEASAVEYDNADSGLTAENVQDAIDEVDGTVDGLVDDVTEISSDTESTKTATGNPITLTDCAPINAESLVVELEPKQDLHGQSAPYVGGAGKNKLPLDLAKIKSSNTVGNWSGNAYYIYGVTFTVNTDDGGNVTGINIDGTLTYSYVDFLLDGDTRKPLDEWGLTIGTTYILSGNRDGAHVIYNGVVANITSGTFTADTSDSYFPCIRITQITYNNVLIQPMVCLATAQNPTIFEKWSNICPITGYTECEVDDVGKNLLDIPDVTLESAGDILNDNVNIPLGTYTLSFGKSAQTEMQYELILKSGATTLIDEVRYTTSLRTAISFTISESADYIRCYVNGTGTFTDIMLEKGSTATTYEPYQSSNATIQFGQTVYGGEVDFLTGVLTVTHLRSMLTNLTKEYFSNGTYSTAYRVSLPVAANTVSYTQPHGAISNMGTEQVSYWGSPRENEEYSSNAPFFAISPTGEYLAVYDNSTTITESDFLTKYNDFELCYPIAVPITYQLTPQELKLLKGTNNITTNGTTINLGYQPDNVVGDAKEKADKINFSEIVKYTISGNTAELIPLVIDGTAHNDIPIVTDITKYRMLCVELVLKPRTEITGVYFSAIAFTDGIYLPSGISVPVYRPSGLFHADVTINPDGNGGFKLSYIAVNQSQSTPPDYYSIRVRAFNQF